MGTKSTT
jgi:hypothetical protein